MQPFSRHAGFFASLKQVEDRLAAEERHQPPSRHPEPPLFSDTMTASPLFLGPATDTTTDSHGGESSGPALDFLTLSKDEELVQEPQAEAGEDDDDSGEDIARLMALLGLSPPRGGSDPGRNDDDDDHSGGCDCSGADGFLAKVVGVVGPKCDKEKKRVDGWVEYYYRDGECREPARLAHLVLAKASWSWEEGEGRRSTSPIVFPTTVKEFLDRDAPPRWTEEQS